MPCQEERLLPGPGSQCWLVAGCPVYRRVLCLSLSHLLEWRGEQWPPCPRATAPCRLTVQCDRRAGRDGWWPWWVGSRRGMSGLSYPCSCNPTPKGTEVLRAFPWRRGRLHGPGQCGGPGAREHLAAALQHLALGRRSRAGAKLVSAAFPWRRGRPAGCAPCLAAARSSSWPPHAGCCCSPQRHASSWPPAPPPARWFPTTGSLTPSSF